MVTHIAIEIHYLNDRPVVGVIRERSMLENSLSFQLLMSEDLCSSEIDVSMILPLPPEFDDGNAISLSPKIPVFPIRNI